MYLINISGMKMRFKNDLYCVYLQDLKMSLVFLQDQTLKNVSFEYLLRFLCIKIYLCPSKLKVFNLNKTLKNPWPQALTLIAYFWLSLLVLHLVAHRCKSLHVIAHAMPSCQAAAELLEQHQQLTTESANALTEVGWHERHEGRDVAWHDVAWRGVAWYDVTCMAYSSLV